jgi:hypothetical protein
MALLAVEFSTDEVLVDHIRLALEIQEMAMHLQLSSVNECTLHSIVAVHLNLISQLTGIPELFSYVKQVIGTRQKNAQCMLPPTAVGRLQSGRRLSEISCEMRKDGLLFESDIVSQILSDREYDISCLTAPFTGALLTHAETEDTKSLNDSQSFSIDNESANSSPLLHLRSEMNHISVTSMKKALEVDPNDIELERERQQKIFNLFHTGAFEDIVAKSEAKSQKFYCQLNKILDIISATGQQPSALSRTCSTSDSSLDDRTLQDASPTATEMTSSSTFAVPVCDMHFPQLIVH